MHNNQKILYEKSPYNKQVYVYRAMIYGIYCLNNDTTYCNTIL